MSCALRLLEKQMNANLADSRRQSANLGAPLDERSSKTGRIVYFLGAGASKSICKWLPVGSGLTLGTLADIREYSDQMPPTTQASRLATFLDAWNDAQRYRDLPLEESLPILKSMHPEEFGLVHYCLAMRLSVDNREYWVPWVEKWLSFVRERRDVIITTNYDTLIETAHSMIPSGCLADCLHCLDFGVRVQRTHKFSYSNRWDGAPELSVLLLKLHGSVSWLFCQNQKCSTYSLDPMWDYALDSIARPGAYPPCPECNEKASRRPVLVSPLRDKLYTDSAIKEIWSAAEDALSRAERVIFAGFSLNANDEAVRSLLARCFAAGATKRVTVIDRNWQAIEKNYRSLYGGVVEPATQRDWRSFLDESFSHQLERKRAAE